MTKNTLKVECEQTVIILVDDTTREPIGRPYLMMGIQENTKAIIRTETIYWPPSEEDVERFLEECLQSAEL